MLRRRLLGQRCEQLLTFGAVEEGIRVVVRRSGAGALAGRLGPLATFDETGLEERAHGQETARRARLVARDAVPARLTFAVAVHAPAVLLATSRARRSFTNLAIAPQPDKARALAVGALAPLIATQRRAAAAPRAYE